MNHKKVDLSDIDAHEENIEDIEEEKVEDQEIRQRRSVAKKYERKKPGPKKRLKETQPQTIMFEVDALEDADTFAHQKGVSRSEYIRTALRNENARQMNNNS